MFERLDASRSLSWNQRKIVAAAMLGDMLEFFDYYLIGFVLAFIVKPWQLTWGESAVILLSSGVGAILGAGFWGWLADRIGRRKVFMATVINFSLATGCLALTPDHGWLFLIVFRFLVGFGVGGLYCVDLPLVQEFMPASRRGLIGGLVTCCIPIGVMFGSLLSGFLAPEIGWRWLFAVGLLPAALTLLIRAWVPESPRWLVRMGRPEDARRSLAWALQVPAESLPLPDMRGIAVKPVAWTDLFRYPRSMISSWLPNLGCQTASNGIQLWAPTLFMLQFGVSAADAAKALFWVAISGFLGRIAFSVLSEAIGRRPSGALVGLAGAAFVIAAGLLHNQMLGTVSLFWLCIVIGEFFYSGGFAIVGPYSAEVWPAHLRTTGMGSAYGFGGIGKIIGPLGLALIVGSADVIKPQVSLDAIVPAFLYFGAWLALAGIVYVVFGIETRGRSIEAIDGQLRQPDAPARVGLTRAIGAE
jgi:MFS transporter, putative metabolite:H+ symporter